MPTLLILAGVTLALVATSHLREKNFAWGMTVFVAFSLFFAVVGLQTAHDEDNTSVTPSTVEPTKAEAATIAKMERALAAEAGQAVVKTPTVPQIKSSTVPTVWEFKDGFKVLCSAADFPRSSSLVCWSPNAAVGGETISDGKGGEDYVGDDIAPETAPNED